MGDAGGSSGDLATHRSVCCLAAVPAAAHAAHPGGKYQRHDQPEQSPDGTGDHAFCYFNLRMARGRSAATQQAAGQALADAAKAHFAPVLARRHVGLTLQVDEGHEVFDAKFGNLHPLFAKGPT